MEFVRRVAVALERHLATHRLPVVLIADAAIQGHFQKLADLGSLLAGVVETNPQVLDVSSIHVAAYDAVRPIFDEGRNRAVDRLSAVGGSRDSHATLDAREIVKAAYLGQVETLMLTEGAGLWGRCDKEVTWTDKAVHVNLTRDQVSKSPAYDPSTTADRAYQDRLYQHYGYQGY